MKAPTLLKSVLAAAILAGALTTQPLYANVELVVDGANSTRTLLYDRASNILSGFTVYIKDANTRSFVGGTLNGQPGLGIVNIHFALNGATGGLLNLRDQTSEFLAYASNGSSNQPPQLAISAAQPYVVGIDGSIFNSVRTLVNPFGFAINSAKSPALAAVTNITQRQLAYLYGASGTLPAAFFGGSGTASDIVYLIGRDTDSAARQVTDANVYVTGTPSFWTTNRAGFQTNFVYNGLYGGIYSNTAIGLPVPNPLGGHNSGALVVADLNVITNGVGTLSAIDFGSFRLLSYEGYAPTTTNIIKGFYPVWSYENYYTLKAGQGAPSPNQQIVISNLTYAITNSTFQHTPGNVFEAGKLIPLADLEVDRAQEGGPITSTKY